LHDDPERRLSLTCISAGNILSSSTFSEHLTELIKKLEDSNAHVRIFGYFIAKALIRRMSGERQVDVAQLVLGTLNEEQITSVDDSNDEVREVGHDDPVL
jgi:U3 small nucleolar RNA-associated protein 10